MATVAAYTELSDTVATRALVTSTVAILANNEPGQDRT